jgi:CBS domain-containing protein
MKVQDCVNLNPTRIRAGATVLQAAEVLSTSQASDLMVVDDDNNFVGVLSEGDLIRAALPRFEEVLAQGEGLSAARAIFEEKGSNLASKPIAPHVIKNPITVAPGDDVLVAATTMIHNQIRRLPVVQGGKLIGTIARADVCLGVLRTS